MSEFSRRDMLSAAAAGGMIAAATSTDGLAEGQPPFGPTPPVLAGAQLPSFRFQLGAVAPKTWNGGWAKEATVAEFPVSEKLAGVLMSLVPGGLRELHWHANAAEWAYVIKGQCRVTTINPQGQSQIADFAAGDVWYFPRGFGHSIQGIGAEDCLFVLVFDNGYFSEFGTFSISDWVGHTPPEVLAKNFGVPACDLRQFSETRGLYRQGTGAAAASRRSRAWHDQPRNAHPSLSPAGAASGYLSGRDQSAGVAARVSDLDHHHRRAHAHQARRHARAALASQCRRMAVLYRRPRPHERVRIPRPRAHWRNSTPATSATCRRATGITSKMPAARISSC